MVIGFTVFIFFLQYLGFRDWVANADPVSEAEHGQGFGGSGWQTCATSADKWNTRSCKENKHMLGPLLYMISENDFI